MGKSSLLIRFVRDEYHEKTRSTISAAYLTRRVDTDSRTVQFEIWDTAGQERFRSLNTPMYYRGAAGAVIVYDVNDPTSFKNARGWYTQLKMLGEPGVQVRSANALSAEECAAGGGNEVPCRQIPSGCLVGRAPPPSSPLSPPTTPLGRPLNLTASSRCRWCWWETSATCLRGTRSAMPPRPPPTFSPRRTR